MSNGHASKAEAINVNSSIPLFVCTSANIWYPNMTKTDLQRSLTGHFILLSQLHCCTGGILLIFVVSTIDMFVCVQRAYDVCKCKLYFLQV